MLGSKYTITNQASASIDFNDYVQGASVFIVLTNYPQFDAEVKNYEIKKEGQHGIWDFYSFYGKRMLNFQGKIVGDTEADVHAQKELLEQVINLPVQPTSSNDGTLTVQWTDPLGATKQIEAKINAPIRYNRKISDKRQLDFSLSLKAADPFYEDQDYTTVSGLRGYTMGSVQLPVTYPTTISWVYEQSSTIVNGGTVQADTVIKLYGNDSFDITNPRVENLTNGKYMKITHVISGADDYVVYNSETGIIQDKDGIDLSGQLVTGSQFVKLEVGSNVVYYTSEENTTSNPVATRISPTELMVIDYKELSV